MQQLCKPRAPSVLGEGGDAIGRSRARRATAPHNPLDHAENEVPQPHDFVA